MDCPYGGDDGECIGEMMTKYRNSERKENEDGDCNSDDIPIGFTQYVEILDLRQQHLLETSIKIHSFICHEELDEDTKSDDDSELEQKAHSSGRGRTEELTAIL